MEVIVKKLASILLVLSTLTGVAGLAYADNDTNTGNIQNLERQNRAGNPAGKVAHNRLRSTGVRLPMAGRLCFLAIPHRRASLTNAASVPASWTTSA
jgi:hypothetical protein